MTTSPIICAIDTPDLSKATALCKTVQPHVGAIKLGLEFFVSHGPQGIRSIADLRIPIFLDLKLHDVPNTIKGAVRAATKLHVAMLTIHTQGGKEMMKIAQDTANEEADKLGITPPLILGVTMLTSLDDNDAADLGYPHSVQDQVLRLVELAYGAGVKGIVCSPQEIQLIRKHCPADITLVTPGIRPAAADDDQKRVLTPKEAMAHGANYLVVGRPITQAENPADAAAKLLV